MGKIDVIQGVSGMRASTFFSGVRVMIPDLMAKAPPDDWKPFIFRLVECNLQHEDETSSPEQPFGDRVINLLLILSLVVALLYGTAFGPFSR